MRSEVKHDKTNNRFYLLAEGYTIQLDYSQQGNVINFFHTYTPPAIRGKGLASEVVKQGLEYAKENNLKVIASCSFVQSFITQNKEYIKLLA